VKKAREEYKSAVKTSKPGEGKRFSALTKQLEAEGKSPKSAKAIAASIGRKKYGPKKMSKMAYTAKIRQAKSQYKG
jgi:hypothetical protein